MSTNKYKLIRGVLSTDGGHFFRAKPASDGPMIPHAWFTLAAWHIDGGSTEKGELTAKIVGVPHAPTGEDWDFELWPGRLVEFKAWYDDSPTHRFDKEPARWRFDSITFDPPDNSELATLALSTTVSAPQQPWHLAIPRHQATASATYKQFEALIEAIGEPDYPEFTKGESRLGALYHHASSRASIGLGLGRPVFIQVGFNHRDNRIAVFEGDTYFADQDTARANARLHTFMHEIVAPAANESGVHFTLQAPPDAVVPDALRREAVPISNLGQAIPAYRVTAAKNPDRAARVTPTGYRFGPHPAPVFDAGEVSLTLTDSQINDPKAHQTLKSFFSLSGDALLEARRQMDQRAWKMVHKKRREFDEKDSAELANVWSQFTTLPTAELDGVSIILRVFKHTREWPSELKLRNGIKVAKFG